MPPAAEKPDGSKEALEGSAASPLPGTTTEANAPQAAPSKSVTVGTAVVTPNTAGKLRKPVLDLNMDSSDEDSEEIVPAAAPPSVQTQVRRGALIAPAQTDAFPSRTNLV